MKLEDNIFSQLYVDFTKRCNLNCSWCSNANLHIDDITTEQFEKICSLIPNKTELRFLGGEPTLHPKLLELIDIAKKHRFVRTIITNGIKFADMDFCKEVKKHGPLPVSISMDADIDDSVQLKAIENLTKCGYKRICLTATLTKENTNIIKYFKELSERYSNIRVLHFRNRIESPTVPFTFKEMEKLVTPVFPEWDSPYKIIRDGKTYKDKKCCGLCQVKRITPSVQMMILDTYRTGDCVVRGYIDNDLLEVNQFFKVIKDRCEEYNA